MLIGQAGIQHSITSVNSDLKNACTLLLAYFECPENNIDQDIIQVYLCLYAFTCRQGYSYSHPGTGVSDEELEACMFLSGDYWKAFIASVKGCKTWSSCSVILICHLRAHRDRLSRYSSRPIDAWLVGWALSNLTMSMRSFLVWSLLKQAGREEAVTIEAFQVHLEHWAALFESEKAKRYVNANISESQLFWTDQSTTTGPWAAQFFASSHKHTLWARTMWARYFPRQS